MEKLLLGLAALALLGSVFYLNQDRTNEDGVPVEIQQQFVQFKNTYNKKYGSTEDSYRLQVFYDNIQYVQQFNEAKGEPTFGQTMFFDLTDQEFEETYLTQLIPEITTQTLQFTKLNDVASEVDWRQKGAVTPVKDQGQCGSCWAFSTTGVLEGYFATTQNVLLSLSEQQLVDCAGITYGNMGCNGGMPGRALNYVEKVGITTEDKYPYKAVKGNCGVQKGEYKNKGHNSIDTTEAALFKALQTSPVSVGVDATKWKYYDPKTKDIFEDCDANLNHAVLAVGYTQDYYIVKNSWTTSWGNQGYIHLKRGNTCGVLGHMTVVV